MKPWIFLPLLLAACAPARTFPEVRYSNAAPVERVDDRRPVARPAEQPFAMNQYYVNQYAGRPVDDALAVRDPHRARDVNSLGEVPDSTWYVNRTPTPADVARGPGNEGAPDPARPWTVRGTKVGGRSLGLTIVDGRGIKYILKFDQGALPEAETAADVIVQRLFWALGYHVPEDYIVYFAREQLVLAPDAKVKDVFGNGKPMHARDLDAVFATLSPGPDGRYRGLASRFLAGAPLGGWPQTGVRADDANDTVAHEDRRELRALYVFCGWLAHGDMKEDNALDMWVEDPADASRHYVMHYLVDFGKTLGIFGKANGFAADGFAHRMDPATSVRSFLSFGLWTRPWEPSERPPWTAIGYFESKAFDPARWQPLYPFEPFDRMDRFDAFWAARTLMKLGRAHIHAAVAQGQLGDPAAAKYLEDTLIARQRKIARHWFARTNPLDGFHVDAGGGTLCFSDLWVQHGFAAPGQPQVYRVDTYDDAGRPLPGRASAISDGTGGVCVEGVPASGSVDAYTIVRLRTRRGGKEVPDSVYVHLARGPSGASRVIGVWRE